MILLDTHVWLWLVDSPQRLPKHWQKKLLEQDLKLSGISCWELSLAHSKGRLQLSIAPETWMLRSLLAYDIEILPITPRIASTATNLPGDFHKDPADRLIVATALVHGLSIATMDTQLRSYGHVKTL